MFPTALMSPTVLEHRYAFQDVHVTKQISNRISFVSQEALEDALKKVDATTKRAQRLKISVRTMTQIRFDVLPNEVFS